MTLADRYQNEEGGSRANENRLPVGWGTCLPLHRDHRERRGVLPRPQLVDMLLALFRGKAPQQRRTDVIWINPYVRVRFGAVEHVTGHFRRLPQ